MTIKEFVDSLSKEETEALNKILNNYKEDKKDCKMNGSKPRDGRTEKNTEEDDARKVLYFEKETLNRKDYRNIEVLATIVRVLLTPIFVWYRLYLWVWDGTMFK